MRLTSKTETFATVELSKRELRILAGGIGEAWNALSESELLQRLGIDAKSAVARIDRLHALGDRLSDADDQAGIARTAGDDAAHDDPGRMEFVSQTETHAALKFSRPELQVLVNGLQEMRNAVAAWEFHPRIGADFDEAMTLMKQLRELVEALRA